MSFSYQEWCTRETQLGPGGGSGALCSASPSQERLSSTGPLRAASLWVWRPLGVASQWGDHLLFPQTAGRQVTGSWAQTPRMLWPPRVARGWGGLGNRGRGSQPAGWIHTSVTRIAESLHQPLKETTSRASISFSVTRGQSPGGDPRKEPVAPNPAGERNPVMEVLQGGSRPGLGNGEGAIPFQTRFPFMALSPK